jgi:DNA invertase Pin-like site-specific DNA recombinase
VASVRRAALYHRVSTLDQNPTLARSELRASARRLGFRVVLDVEETGSGAQNDRPGFKRVLEAARLGKIDALLVYKLDRAGRSALDLLANIRELVEVHGVRFVVTSQGLDLKPGGDAISRLLMTVLAAVAEFERDLIRDRTRLGLAAARRRGVRLGRRPSPGPSTSEVLARRAAGESWAAIAGALQCTIAKARRLAAASLSRSPERINIRPPRAHGNA